MSTTDNRAPSGKKSRLPYEEALTKLNDYIESHNMRHTPEREMVLNEICDMQQPFTAEQLTERCKPLRLTQATVYNSLKLFIVARILHSFVRETGRSATQYELAVATRSTVMMVCTRCGRTVELRDKTAIDHIVAMRKYSNFVPENYSMRIYGHCKLCRRILARGGR